jgi:hypothetical protein
VCGNPILIQHIKTNSTFCYYSQMKHNINERAEGNISKYYSGGKISLSDYLNGLNQEEKTKILHDAYSCIDMFYQVIDDSKG